MVLAVPPANLDRFLAVCAAEEVEATAIGRFADHGRLVIRHGGLVVADLEMRFLHGGLPRLTRTARWVPPVVREPDLPPPDSLGEALLRCLSDFGVASKEWVIRQYDHEVQAGSAVKPLCGSRHDGPADAAVLAPKLGSLRGLVIGNGLNPRYSKIDPAAMAECALDEAMRNIVAAGGDPARTAVLDNYCWGNTEKPDRLGGLVRASLALRDVALCYGTPFVSGKDSLNNEYRTGDRTVAIPGCILVTALSVIPDVTRAVTTDLKGTDHAIYLVGVTKSELGGSVYYKTRGELGASVPRVDAPVNKRGFDAVARALASGAALACHDLSEGGLAVAAAEMAIGGRTGVRLELASVPAEPGLRRDDHVLFSESAGRFLIECASGREADLEANLDGVVFARVGTTLAADRMQVTSLAGGTAIDLPLADLVRAWQDPLALDAGPNAPGGNP
jgi:phosphoribosylformylglycinamidine synthase